MKVFIRLTNFEGEFLWWFNVDHIVTILPGWDKNSHTGSTIYTDENSYDSEQHVYEVMESPDEVMEKIDAAQR